MTRQMTHAAARNERTSGLVFDQVLHQMSRQTAAQLSLRSQRARKLLRLLGLNGVFSVAITLSLGCEQRII